MSHKNNGECCPVVRDERHENVAFYELYADSETSDRFGVYLGNTGSEAGINPEWPVITRHLEAI